MASLLNLSTAQHDLLLENLLPIDPRNYSTSPLVNSLSLQFTTSLITLYSTKNET